jgi:GntR family transcriptional regulator
MDKLCSDSAQPLYKQLAQAILNAICTGEYRPGDKLPSEEELQKQFGLSRVTVRNAIQVLVEEEMLLRIHGKGTFVVGGKFSENIFSGGSFTDTCLKMNVKPSTRIITRKIQPAKQKIAAKLGISNREDIIFIQRLRLVDDVVCILEYDYCPGNFRFILDMDMENKSLFSLFREKLDLHPASFDDHFSLHYASKEDAVLLECEQGSALLRVDQIIRTKTTGVLYYNMQLIRSDRYTYAVRWFE